MYVSGTHFVCCNFLRCQQMLLHDQPEHLVRCHAQGWQYACPVRNAASISFTSFSITGMGDNNLAGSKFPCSVILSPANCLADCGLMHQSMPSPCAPVAAMASRLCHAPFAKMMVGTVSFNAATICRIYCRESCSKSSGLNNPPQLSKI
jgi:hypothetical protein